MEILTALALLACPVGMGVMMWYMARGSRSESEPRQSEQRPSQPRPAATVDELRAEHERIAARLRELEDDAPTTAHSAR